MRDFKRVQVFREFFLLFVSRSPLAHISPPCFIFVAIVGTTYVKKLGLTCAMGCRLKLHDYKDNGEHAMCKHQDRRDYTCHCGESYATLKTLNRHMNTKAHSQPRPVEQPREVSATPAPQFHQSQMSNLHLPPLRTGLKRTGLSAFGPKATLSLP